jgi:hypothetical protein
MFLPNEKRGTFPAPISLGYQGEVTKMYAKSHADVPDN